MIELSKAARKAIRDAASIAYERELANALEDLAQIFQEWKAGSRNAFDVSDAIHEFHQGTARELFKQYEAGSNSVPDFAVAAAVVGGFIKLEEIGPAGRDHVAKIVEAMSAARRK
jgi:phage-related minor tail protein